MQTFGLSEDWIQKLKDNTNIVSIVSKYVTLKQKGKTWWACCPFHFEKTPSFTVNEYDQYFKCFGCGVGGDVISFVRKMESCDFYDACKILAKEANMELPEVTNDINIAKQKKSMDKSYNILKETARHYYENLKSDNATPALEYLAKRKVQPETIKAFGLGYSLNRYEIVNYLKSKGYTYEEMKDAGVVDYKDGKYVDCYAGRLVFPIINVRGDVVGFSARVLEKTDFAKYKNTAATLIFDKSRCVFGINLVKKEKQTKGLDNIIIVEGQMDVVALWQCGVKNAVACMGTAMTPNHAREIKKLTDKVVLCFDGDGAGIKATQKGIDILVQAGLEVFVIGMPEGLDPDEYINKYGKDKYDELINSAKYWAEYLIRNNAKNLNKSNPNSVNNFVKNSMVVIRKLTTESEKFIYLNMIKGYTNISIDVLKKDYLAVKDESGEVKENQNEEKKEELLPNSYVKAINFVLASMLHNKEYAQNVQNINDLILDSDKKKLYSYILDCKSSGKPLILGNVYTYFDVEENTAISSIVDFEFTSDIDNADYFDSCLKSLQSFAIDRQKQEITKKLHNVTDANERRQLLEQMSNLIKKQNKGDK